jgi:hypothetical protein
MTSSPIGIFSGFALGELRHAAHMGVAGVGDVVTRRLQPARSPCRAVYGLHDAFVDPTRSKVSSIGALLPDLPRSVSGAHDMSA